MPEFSSIASPGEAAGVRSAEAVRAVRKPLSPWVAYVLVPLMLLAASVVMASAWLGHLRYRGQLSFFGATALAWVIVLPEYTLNIAALRLGYRRYTGGQMAAFRLCSGVVSVAVVSRVVLDEPWTPLKLLGFAIMFLAVFLVASVRKTPPVPPAPRRGEK